MRSLFLGTLVLTTLIAASWVQAQPADWPAAKKYVADTDDPKLVTDQDLPFLGWKIPSGEKVNATQTPPGTVGGLPAELDVVGSVGGSGKLKYSTSGSSWTFTAGQNVTTAIIWRVYIDPSTTSSGAPSLQIGNGTTRYRLDFTRNVSGETGCELPGWKGSDNTQITEGGKRVPNSPTDRYLPMSVGEWHTIRFQVSPNGLGGTKFDAWLDEAEGGSDHHHVSGICTQGSGSTYVQWGVLSTKSGLTKFATNMVAWGQDVPAQPAEIPALPFTLVENCNNGIDDDGDGLADCNGSGGPNPGPDPGCDCVVPGAACLKATDVVEKFNVNFADDPAAPGRVPDLLPNHGHWDRTHYGHPGYTDEDPTTPPGASSWDLDPFDEDLGPYFYLKPGPYAEEHDAMFDACMAGEINWDDYPEFVEGWHACAPAETDCCTKFAGWLFHPTQPFRVTLVLDRIPNNPEDPDNPGCGSMLPACMAGDILIQRQVTANDLASLPIDWAQPVTVSASALGIDHGVPANGSLYDWQTYVTFGGYTISQETRIEWGSDGDAPNGSTTADYRTVSAVLAPGQGSPPGATTLTLGVHFDYNGLSPLPIDTSTAFFENVRLNYTVDVTKPLLRLSKMVANHEINQAETLPNDTFTVKNAGVGVMNYTITDDAAWLDVSPGSGSSTGEADTIDIIYSGVASLSAGEHVATITVASPEIDKSAAQIVVTVTVIGPHIELSASQFSHTILLGQSIANDGFTVTNTGGGTLQYAITDGGATWLDEVPGSGESTGESDPIQVVYSAQTLPVGQYNATITVADEDADNNPQTIAVSVKVQLAPPDYDNDGDVDQVDFGIFQLCITGEGHPTTPGLCADYADLHGNDDDVDQSDWAEFEKCATGPGVAYVFGTTCTLGGWTPPP